MVRLFIVLFSFLFLSPQLAKKITAQSMVFGPKIGPSISLQTWNNLQRRPLLSYNASFFIESYKENEPSSLYAEVGYHVRGSSERQRFVNLAGTDFLDGGRLKYRFKNVNLVLGAKRLLTMESSANLYYLLAIRGEYTISTDFGSGEQTNFYAGYIPFDNFINKINYGFTVGGGYQFEFNDLVGAALEFRISPDISKQYDQAVPIPNIVNPYRNGAERITLPPQVVRNISMEISAVLRLKRIVEYK